MNDNEAYKMIGERAAQMANDPKIQAEMMRLVQSGKTIKEVESWLYIRAIGTLCR